MEYIKCRERIRHQQEIGSKFRDTYEYAIDEKGHKTLVKTGEENIYSKIQEGLESTKIENILQRAMMGDPEALNRKKGDYLDCTEMPKTLAEAQNTIIKLRNEFNSLPVETRRQFDMSPEKYIQQYGSEAWATALGFVKEVKNEETAPITNMGDKEEGDKK